MSCHGCAEKFGFLKKEHGCPHCGFAYCKKCLRFPAVHPGNKKQMMVCFKCQNSLQSAEEPIVVINALQRLESMDDPAKPPITVYRQPARQARLQELKRGLSIEDQHILERLESLKREDDETRKGSGPRRTSEKIEEEIAERLAKLKDEEYRPESEMKSNILKNIKPQTEEDIIAKFTAEVEMDSKYEAGVVRDIEERLAKLRGEPTQGPSKSNEAISVQKSFPDTEDLSEEDQIKLIMQRLQDELDLEQKAPPDSGQDMDTDQAPSASQVEQALISDDDDIDVDDLCGICSEKRATLQCEECDGDIFCKACCQELHRDLGEVHRLKPFKKK